MPIKRILRLFLKQNSLKSGEANILNIKNNTYMLSNDIYLLNMQLLIIREFLIILLKIKK